MPYIQLNDKRLTLGPGENRVPGAPGTEAVVTLDGSGSASIKAEAGSVVKVNGVTLGTQPSPLLHGDKIEIGNVTMSFADDGTSGSTQYMSRANVADLLKSAGVDDAKQAAATGGRLVSLVDGREYIITGGAFTIGRDPGSDVVVASGQASRSHAEIEVGAGGYYIIDTSTNGVYVNNRRVEGTQTLNKGDIIRIAEEEFRFYADEMSVAPSATIPAPQDATRVPVQQPEEKKKAGLPWWLWLLVAIILVAGVYFVIQGR